MLYTSKNRIIVTKQKGLQGRNLPFYICNTSFLGKYIPIRVFSHNLTAVFLTCSSCRVKGYTKGKAVHKIQLVKVKVRKSPQNYSFLSDFTYRNLCYLQKRNLRRGFDEETTKTFIVSLTLCIAFTIWGLFPNLLLEKVV